MKANRPPLKVERLQERKAREAFEQLLGLHISHVGSQGPQPRDSGYRHLNVFWKDGKLAVQLGVKSEGPPAFIELSQQLEARANSAVNGGSTLAFELPIECVQATSVKLL